MKKYRLSLSIIVLLASMIFTGCIYKSDNYNPPPQNNTYSNIFNEDFYNDNLGWAFDDPADSAYAFVTQDGLYKFVDYSFKGGYHTAVVPTGFYANHNFLVQARIRSNNAMGLIFGASDNNYGYSVFIDDAGYFAVYKEGSANSPIQTIIDWQKTNAINAGWNDIEIEQVGNTWYGYINNTQVFQTPAQYIAGSRCGFMVLANTTGYADYLTVKW